MTIRVFTRDDWGGGPRRSGYAAPHSQFTAIKVHHTVMVMQDYDGDGFLHGDLEDTFRYMRKLQVVRPDLGSEVPYSWVVFQDADDGDAIVCEGRGWGWTGAHTAGHNSTSYGVAYAANSIQQPPTPGVLEGIRWVGRNLYSPTTARPTLGHRDVKATSCPGDPLYAELPNLQPPFALSPVPTPPPSPTLGPTSYTPLEYVMDTLDLRNAHNVPVRGRHVDNMQALLIPVLVMGRRGDLVKGLVNGYGLPDGIAGKGTREALRVGQDILRYVGVLHQDSSDMVCGPKTWKAIIEF